jgi:Cytochrome P450
MFWELARNPSWQNQLHQELLTRLPANDEVLPCFRDLDDLPVLDAVINEALCLHPAAPPSLQRETPVGGKVLDGYHIPEKVNLSHAGDLSRTPINVIRLLSRCSAILFNEIRSRFRILVNLIPLAGMESNEVSSEMKERFMPFSEGSRACLGKVWLRWN